jgi:antitoxin MazE
MIVKVQKWGNSHGLRIGRHVLEDAGLSAGDPVDVVVRNGTLVVTPVRRVRGRIHLKDLIARIPRGYKPQEVRWGPPVGKEVW